jgi:hypothetical protein
MNQAIIFTERVEFRQTTGRVYFFAQVNGQLIACYYTTQKKQLEALKSFEQNKFDYEDMAESLIEDEMFNEFGEIELEELL